MSVHAVIALDEGSYRVTVDGLEITNLTAMEFRVLLVLAKAHGTVVTREQLLREAWHYRNPGGIDTRTVDVHMGRLKRKLGPGGECIATVRNQGYRLMAPAAPDTRCFTNVVLAEKVPVSDLTPRQVEILKLIADGFTTKEIGARLGVSPKTADSHRSALAARLGLHGTAELTRYAVRTGLVNA